MRIIGIMPIVEMLRIQVDCSDVVGVAVRPMEPGARPVAMQSYVAARLTAMRTSGLRSTRPTGLGRKRRLIRLYQKWESAPSSGSVRAWRNAGMEKLDAP